MCSARLSSTALSTRGSHGAVEVAYPGFAEVCASSPASWGRASADSGLGGRGAAELAVLCPHGHLSSRFQIGSLAGSLAGVAGAVYAGRGTDASVARRLVGACAAPCGALRNGGLSGASERPFSLTIRRASNTVTLSAPPAAFAASTRRRHRTCSSSPEDRIASLRSCAI